MPPEGLPPCVLAQQQPEQIPDQMWRPKQQPAVSVQQLLHHLDLGIAKHTAEPRFHRHYTALELLLHLPLTAATNKASKSTTFVKLGQEANCNKPYPRWG